MSDYLNLYDYRTRVAAMYRARAQALLAGEDAVGVWKRFHEAKDDLFAHHPQSALSDEQRRNFQGLRYFPYNPALCVIAEVDINVEPVQLTVPMDAIESMTMTRVGRLQFTVENQAVGLALYWLNIYGGGLFLPFRDTTCPVESYGGGRYLFDTIKGSDFLPAPGSARLERLVLDFNYAYNPSCAYNDRWVCPLAPLENRLNIPIRAGEMNFKH
ncbi:MAG TPA: DUF1684 domain-containing protein [Ktedonobacteraceae bacterium]|jgi:uncharacterized protein (DUF1684 family)|nr:DUF1684 domain-containing protein [Ktedonobacteraceae bacterium]